MEVLNSVKDYRKYLPEYNNWRDKQDLEVAKRVEYLKQNPDRISQEDIQRGKNLLHAIDVMDEYSQSYAEDMEVATEFAKGQIVGIATTVGMVGGTLLTFTPAVKKMIQKIGKGNTSMMVAQMLPSVIGMLVGFAASFPAVAWATKAKITASRKGRFEAMRKDLENPAIFATLTEEQSQKAEKESKNIELDAKTLKRLQNSSMNAKPTDSIKTLKKYFKEDNQYQIQKKEFEAKLKESEKNFDKQLSESQIHNAQKDQQILAHMVRKIDLASQDYAENTELATNTLTTLALAGGGLVGWVSNKLIKVLKIAEKNKFSKIIPWAVGLTIPILMSIYAAKVQKQASRIGRYKAKQEMLNNPETLVYVAKKDFDKMTDVKTPEQAKKPNMIKFFFQLIKDNKEYEKYRKTELVEDLKRHKAIEKLELTEQQLKDAKTLQMNVFKTFNKVDEKSQTYSESVEAVGEITKQAVSVFGSLIATGISTMSTIKMLEDPKFTEKGLAEALPKMLTKTLLPFAFVLLPIILIDIYTTKAQKKASRVADMLALKELEDYKHYAGYSDNDLKPENRVENIKESNTESNLLRNINMKTSV